MFNETEISEQLGKSEVKKKKKKTRKEKSRSEAGISMSYEIIPFESCLPAK